MSDSARPSEPAPRRRFRWLRWTLAGIGVLLLLPVLALGGALLYANTEGGRERIAQLAGASSPASRSRASRARCPAGCASRG
jgi:Tfp pilus assembly protein PilN